MQAKFFITPRQRSRGQHVLSFLLTVTLSLPTFVHAEGSREFVSNGGYRPFLEFASKFTTTQTYQYNTPRQGRIYVFAQAGEQVLLGSSVHNATDNKEIVYRSPTGAQTGFCDVKDTGEGFIANPTQENHGPFPSNGGYTPCQFTASETGVYEIEFHGRTYNPTPSSPPFTITKSTDAFPIVPDTNQSKDIFTAAWDVTVMNNGVEKKGRAYTKFLPMDTAGYAATLNSVVYILTNQGFLYRVNLNGLQPYQFFFFANNKGFRDSHGNSLLKSVDLPTTTPSSALFHAPHLADTATDVTHKIFFNPPDEESLPKDQKVPSADANENQTWLLTTQPQPPDVENFTFIGEENTIKQAGTAPMGGMFSFTVKPQANASVTEVSFSLVVDINNNDILGDANDRMINGRAKVGQMTSIAWDGLDGEGNPIPAQPNPYQTKLRLTIDDVHFPFLDIEVNPKGLIVERVNRSAPSSVESSIIYYNDKDIITNNAAIPPNPLITPKDGVSSSTGAHGFSALKGQEKNGFGNSKGIDTWTSIGNTFDLGGLLIRQADLAVTKAHDPLNPTSGSAVTYTIVVKNNGPSDASDIKVYDEFPSQITGTLNWTCTPSSSCGASSGSGKIDTTVSLQKDATATFTITGGTVNGSPGQTITNLVTITRPNDLTNPLPGLNAKTEEFPDPLTIAALNNQAPTAENVTTSTPNDTLVKLPPLAGTDTDGSIVSFTIKTLPPAEQGILCLGNPNPTCNPVSPGQSFTSAPELWFLPDPNFVGAASFTYEVKDDKGATSPLATGTINVTTALPNNPPKTENITVSPDVPNNTTQLLPPLKATDPDDATSPAGQVVSYTIVTLPPEDEGILSLNGTPVTPNQVLTPEQAAQLSFQPKNTFVGTSNFSYTATDGKGAQSNVATVSIPVKTSPPVAQDISASPVSSGTTAQLPPLVANDDEMVQSYTIASLPAPEQGILYLGDPEAGGTPVTSGTPLSLNDISKLYFKADPTFTTGSASFTYTATDNKSLVSNPATVTIPSTQPTLPSPPIANDDKATTFIDEPVKISILNNDTGTSSGKVTITTPPGQGQVTVNTDGTITYTPKPGFVGTDTLTYQVCRGDLCDTATVTITVSSPVPPTPPLPIINQFTLAISFGGGGTGSIISQPEGIQCDTQSQGCQHLYDVGTSVVLTPVPDPGFEFSSWGGHEDCADGVVSMINSMLCIAYFTPSAQPKLELTVEKIGGEGTITSQGGEIQCGTSCQKEFPGEVPVVLTAIPQPGFIFKEWKGECSGTSSTITVVMSQSKTCQAVFEAVASSPDTHPLTVTKVGTGNGTVTSASDTINCGGNCAYSYPENIKVTLTAASDKDSNFIGWSGDCHGLDTTVTVTMDKAKGCIALFDLREPLLPPSPNTEAVTIQNLTHYKATITSDPAGIKLTPEDSYGAKSTAFYPIGTTVKLTATPEDPELKFSHFEGDEDCRDGEITVTSKNINCLAIFKEPTPGTLQFSSASYTVDESGKEVATISITRTEGCDGPVTVDYGTEPVSAKQPIDFSNATGTLSWMDGDCSEKTFTIPIQDDTLIEGDEALQLNLSYPTGGAEIGSLAQATLAIIDDDKPGSTSSTPVSTTSSQPTSSCYSSCQGGCSSCNSCSSCQQGNTQTEESGIQFKSLVTTLKVGETQQIALSGGKGDFSIAQFPESKIASLEAWVPTGKGAGELTLRGVSVGTTYLTVVDSAAPSSKTTVHINVIEDKESSSPSQEENNASSENSSPSNQEGGSPQTLHTKIEVGQSFTVSISGKGELSLNELPNKAFAALDTWRVIGNSAQLSVTGTSVGTTQAVIIDQNNPPQKTIIEIEVIPNQAKVTETNNPQVPSTTTTSPPAGYIYNPTTGKYSNPETGREWIGSSSPPTGYQYDPNTGKYTDPQTGKTWTGTDYEYDPSTGKYYDPQTGDYYSYNPLKEPTLVESETASNCSPANGLQLPVQGQTSASPACFLSKLSTIAGSQANHKMFAQSDAQALRLSTTIYPDPKHVGQSADILLVGVRTTLTWETRYMRDLENHWVEWDDEISHLQATQSYTLLPQQVEVSIYEGDLSFAPGEYTAFVGYRLRNGTIVHNGAAPLHFYIGNASSVNLRQSSTKTSYSQEVYTTSYFDLHVHNNHKPGKFGNHQVFENEEFLNLNSFVRIDPRHVGQAADIVMWALYQHGEERVTYARAGAEWETWEGQWGSLKSAQYYDRLPEVLYIPIYLGQLSNLPGQFTLYVGYRLSGEVMVFNGADPIQFTVDGTQGVVREVSRWVTPWVKEP